MSSKRKTNQTQQSPMAKCLHCVVTNRKLMSIKYQMFVRKIPLYKIYSKAKRINNNTNHHSHPWWCLADTPGALCGHFCGHPLKACPHHTHYIYHFDCAWSMSQQQLCLENIWPHAKQQHNHLLWAQHAITPLLEPPAHIIQSRTPQIKLFIEYVDTSW